MWGEDMTEQLKTLSSADYGGSLAVVQMACGPCGAAGGGVARRQGLRTKRVALRTRVGRYLGPRDLVSLRC